MRAFVDSRDGGIYIVNLMISNPHQSFGQTVATHRVAIFITMVVTTLSFFLHLKWCGSLMQLEENFFVSMIRFHQTTHPLSIRVFTSDSILLLTGLGLSVKQAYFLLQYTLVPLLGVSFYRYLLSLGFTKSNANIGLFLLLSAYPILAAHIEPVHTWDDIWCHLFLTLTLTALIKARPWAGLVWFTLACFAREQSFVFLPIVAYTYWQFSRQRSVRVLMSIIVVPIVLYGVYYAFNWQPPDPARFSLIVFNFENPLRSSDTLFSLFISFGLLWVTTLVGLTQKRTSPISHLLYWGTVISVPSTLIIALFFACARETRLLFPPFLFVIPIGVIILRNIYDTITADRSRFLSALAVFVILMAVGIVLGNVAFPEFEYRRCQNFQRLWAGIHFGLIFCVVAFAIRWGWGGFSVDRK